MTAQSALSRIKIGNTVITNSTLVRETLKITLSGRDASVNTSDGKISFLRTAKTFEGSFLVYGDASGLATAPCAEAEVTLFSGSSQILKFNACVSVSYEPRNDISSINISGL